MPTHDESDLQCICHSLLRRLVTEVLHERQNGTENQFRRHVEELDSLGKMGGGALSISIAIPLMRQILEHADHPDPCQMGDLYYLGDGMWSTSSPQHNPQSKPTTS